MVRSSSAALDALESLRAGLSGRGVVFALARVKQDLLVDLDAFGLRAAVGPDRIFPIGRSVRPLAGAAVGLRMR